MALPATGTFEVQSGASDTACSAFFDPGNASMDATGAITLGTSSAPNFTVSGVTFTTNDTGHWLFLKSGTNIIPGWYKMTWDGGSGVNLDAAIGHAVLYSGNRALGPNTALGCGTAASMSSITWACDYTQKTSARISFTDLATGGGSAVTCTSAGNPFDKRHVANSILITAGTNWTTGLYSISSVSGTTATLDRTPDAGSPGTGGTGGLGGAFGSPGKAGQVAVSGNDVWIKTGTYSITSTSSNVTVGVVTLIAGVDAANLSRWEGYGSVRGDKGTRPTLQLQASLTVGGISIMTAGVNFATIDNIVVDANTGNTTANGINATSTTTLIRVKAMNCTNVGISTTSTSARTVRCEAVNCSGVAGMAISGKADFCDVHGCTTIGFKAGSFATFTKCKSYANTGASSDGFSTNAQMVIYEDCIAYANGRYGFDFSGTCQAWARGCVAYGNTTKDYKEDGVKDTITGINNAGTLSAVANFPALENQITLSADPFTNGASGDFSLNTTAGGGAALRAIAFVCPDGTTTSYENVGGVNPQAGSSVILVEDD